MTGVPKSLQHMFSAKRLVNLERAYTIMDEHGLDGLVAATPANIYYLSSHSGIMQWMGRHFSTFAFLPREENAPPALILPSVMLYHLDYRPTWIETIQVYSMPQVDDQGQVLLDPDGLPVANPRAAFWPMGDGERTERDDLLIALGETYHGKTSASPLAALAKALKDAGLARGRLGFDDPRILPWLQDNGVPDVTGVDALNIFKSIRMVKTENEIDILREAAQRNEQALDYAMNLIEPGQPLEEIEFNHAKKWAELGGRSKWLIANIRGLNSGRIAPGDFMKLDSVGAYKGYLGDVGRTVMVGDPPDSLVKRIEANTKVAKIIYDAIKPGMKFAEAAAMFTDLMRQEGVERAYGAPHNVGMEHADEPWPTGAEKPGENIRDFVFEAGTVFTLDMPYSEIGWGTTHVEDMIVVRENGYEALSSMDTSLRIRPV